jgi:hypothetical protein
MRLYRIRGFCQGAGIVSVFAHGFNAENAFTAAQFRHFALLASNRLTFQITPATEEEETAHAMAWPHSDTLTRP